MQDGLSVAQIAINLLPIVRSASAIRCKKKELREKYGGKLHSMANPDQLHPRTPATPAPPMPARKPWSSTDAETLRKCISKGMTDIDIQLLHFPNRTEDSVIGKIRKLRAASNKKSEGAGAHAALPSSLSQYARSSPALPLNSSQTAQRSSPAQAALKRKAEVVSGRLAVLHEDDPVDDHEAGKSDSGKEYAPQDTDDAASDGQDLKQNSENADPHPNDLGLDDVGDAKALDEAKEDSGMPDMNAADADNQSAPESAAEVTVPDTPSPVSHAELDFKRRTAYVVVPERPNLSDVIDLRAQPASRKNHKSVIDHEARYTATTPPFRPGQESDVEGIFRSTKLSLWRDAYSKCGGDAEAAYREYESLRTDEHMLQAVCNLEYEIINGIKAVRMRRNREDAIRKGKPPPVTPIQDQPMHLDLFGPKEYGRNFSYKSWARETKEMYLNEPIVYGPRPVPGAQVEYSDPMHDAMHDDGDDFDGDDFEGDDGYDRVDDNFEENDSYDDYGSYNGHGNDWQRDQAGRRHGASESFHGHVSEIDDDEENVESRTVVLSHHDAESALELKGNQRQKGDARENSLTAKGDMSSPASKDSSLPAAFKDAAEAPSAAGKQSKASQVSINGSKAAKQRRGSPTAKETKATTQTQSMSEECMASPTAKKQPEIEVQHVTEQDMAPIPPLSKKRKSSIPDEHNTLAQSKGQKKLKSQAETKDIQPSMHAVNKQQLPVAQTESTSVDLKQTDKWEKPKEGLQQRRHSAGTRSTPCIDAQSMPPPANNKRTGSKPRRSKVTPVLGKDGRRLSRAALRRQKQAMRRSDASATSEATTERSKIVPTVPTEATVKQTKTSPVVLQATTTVKNVHSEDNQLQWMHSIVKNAKHKPPPAQRKSPPPIDPSNLFGRGDPSDESSSESESESDTG